MRALFRLALLLFFVLFVLPVFLFVGFRYSAVPSGYAPAYHPPDEIYGTTPPGGIVPMEQVASAPSRDTIPPQKAASEAAPAPRLAEAPLPKDPGAPALVAAARDGQAGTVEEMLSHGANLNARDLLANTALHYAARNGHMATVETLLRRGADMRAVNNEGKQPLHLAVENGNMTTAEKLLSYGADLEALTNEGKTPLHLAAERGHNGIAQMLRNRGARTDTLDNAGRTPYQLAIQSGHQQTARVIQGMPNYSPGYRPNSGHATYSSDYSKVGFLGIIGAFPVLLIFLLLLMRRKRRPVPPPAAAGDEQPFLEFWMMAQKMEERIVNLETILKAGRAEERR